MALLSSWCVLLIGHQRANNMAAQTPIQVKLQTFVANLPIEVMELGDMTPSFVTMKCVPSLFAKTVN